MLNFFQLFNIYNDKTKGKHIIPVFTHIGVKQMSFSSISKNKQHYILQEILV